MTGTRKKPKPSPLSPPVVVGLPAVIDAPQQTDHPHQNFDRAARAAVARLSGGVSTHAFIEAWSDWAQHLARAPGRQMELAEHAKRSLLKLMALATIPGGAPPFSPKPYDHRFDHAGWQRPPFQMWQQGFDNSRQYGADAGHHDDVAAGLPVDRRRCSRRASTVRT